ncbi:hypothetical protein HanXRQr2_Chr15g0683541 [Helianthus annuus]|uniref:Uncharacterized protein n=1 Tax=Helianthus annuus TaxID=4232 RepID=A0A9K3DY96_HELAN|nr:hypothetical protein HanXRQr2_Chr15g0683541 [Helianthus annuus]KAJ0830441.1 hypothetical protein HanPSC8_Chr15g0655461 [Helianthus annuus]
MHHRYPLRCFPLHKTQDEAVAAWHSIVKIYVGKDRWILDSQETRVGSVMKCRNSSAGGYLSAPRPADS